ncbi:hypothetical protein E2C01_079148 [Portunus trituberculatus]|uniref:Uncharacterized protein n=1 Tax=Portunus trituberculatus TaxID=210409 RepID=A0A5B7IIV9_PORTR|nr:hypothetical protein [Portunus trituberculatus]
MRLVLSCQPFEPQGAVRCGGDSVGGTQVARAWVEAARDAQVVCPQCRCVGLKHDLLACDDSKRKPYHCDFNAE